MITREECINIALALYDSTQCDSTKDKNLTELEDLIQSECLLLGRKLLETRLAYQVGNGGDLMPRCPRCNGKLREQKTAQARTLKTILGEVEYKRPYKVCDHCGYTCAPLDQALGIPETGPTIGALKKICHAAVVTRSFNDGREILEVHSGLKMSRKHVRTIAEREGERLLEEQARKVELFQEGKMEVVNTESPELIVVTCDGGRIQTRGSEKENRWKEDKIGAVYEAVPQPSSVDYPENYKSVKAGIKTYVATMREWDFLGWLLRIEAEQRGYQKARQKLFLADGAKHIREVKNLHFPDTVFVLDWPHAVGHLNECARAVFGEGTTKAKEWYLELKQLLWDGKTTEIIGQLEKLARHLGVPGATDNDSSPRRILHRNTYSFFPNNIDAMNYPMYRAKGWPIGSGVVESAVKQFAMRLKGSEKFWNVRNTGAEEMLALCALYHCEDGRWDRYWDKRAQPIKH